MPDNVYTDVQLYLSMPCRHEYIETKDFILAVLLSLLKLGACCVTLSDFAALTGVYFD